MRNFKSIKNIHEELTKHNKNLLFLKLNKYLKLFIKSMPPDIKHKLTQRGVVCDVFSKYNKNFFRIRVYHPSLAQDIRNDSTKRAILQHIKNFSRLMPEYANILKLFPDEIIIQSNAILKAYMNFTQQNRATVLLKDTMSVDFKNLLKDSAQRQLLDEIIHSRLKTNAKIKALRKD